MKLGAFVILGASTALLAGCGRSTELSALPNFQWNSFEEYRAAPYIRAARRLHELGYEPACRILAEEAKKKPASHQVIVLCRMLFKKRVGSEFRRPLLGAAHFFGGTDYGDWPSESIELRDGIPFLITRGYTLAGVAVPADSYLRYCVASCDWRTDSFSEPSQAELKSALAKLITSDKWKRHLDASE